MRRKKTVGDIILDIMVLLTMLLVLIATLYPFLNSLALSFNNADDTTRGGITIWPRIFTTRNYELIFANSKIYKAYSITVLRTLIGTVVGLLFTATLAFGLSRRNLRGRKFYTYFCLIPMYFSGGLIPTYFLIRSLNLLNNFWVYILPNLVNLWNMLLMRAYFKSVPDALEESARIDGANYFTIFYRIILPVSMPIVATICLYIGVFHWNSWFDAAMFISSQQLKPMQTVLISIISEAKFAEQIASAAAGASVDVGSIGRGKVVNVRSITMATMIVTITPIVIVYPFLQRYFIKGIKPPR